MKVDNFSIGLLDLFELSEVIPETGFGDDVVGSENPHAAIDGSDVRRRSVLDQEGKPILVFREIRKDANKNSLKLGGFLSFGGKLSANDGVLGESAHTV